MSGRDNVYWGTGMISWGRAIGDLNRRRPWLKLVVLGVIIIALVVTLILIYRKKDGGVEQKMAVMATLEQPTELAGVSEKEGEAPAEEKADTKEVGVAREIDYTGKKLAALTFDDGPDAETTPRLLDVLKEKQAVATFFMLGGRMDAVPEVAQRAAKEGHEVESHSLQHANLARYGAEALAGDLTATAEIFNRVLGHGPKYLRPPYGAISPLMRGQIELPLMLWSVDTRDWEVQDAGVVRENARRDVFDGAVVLMHDIYGTTVEAAGGIIDDLRADGYELVTVEKLVELRRKEPLERGVAYGKFMVE